MNRADLHVGQYVILVPATRNGPHPGIITRIGRTLVGIEQFDPQTLAAHWSGSTDYSIDSGSIRAGRYGYGTERFYTIDGYLAREHRLAAERTIGREVDRWRMWPDRDVIALAAFVKHIRGGEVES